MEKKEAQFRDNREGLREGWKETAFKGHILWWSEQPNREKAENAEEREKRERGGPEGLNVNEQKEMQYNYTGAMILW